MVIQLSNTAVTDAVSQNQGQASADSQTTYGCDECDREECETTTKANSRMFADDVVALFEHLSKWPAVASPTERITFELNVSSPSDAQHMFAPLEAERCVRSKKPGYSRESAMMRLLGYQTREYNLNHAFGNLHSSWDTPFAVPQEARMIDCFTVNQSTFRALGSGTLRVMLESMPNLRRVNYEPWVIKSDWSEQQGHRDNANAAFFKDLKQLAMRGGLRMVALWEARSQRLHRHAFRRYRLSGQSTLTSRAVSASLYVTDFALTHTSDASCFLKELCAKVVKIPTQPPSPNRPRHQEPFEPLLERLALSIDQMNEVPDDMDMENLNDPEPFLVKAALAAACLPRLKVMELWTPGVGKGFFFRYHVKEEEEARITVASTWHIDKSQKVSEAWEKVVAERHPDLAFHYDTEHIDPESLTEPDSISKHMELWYLLREW